jgi:hypothetical protein
MHILKKPNCLNINGDIFLIFLYPTIYLAKNLMR